MHPLQVRFGEVLRRRRETLAAKAGLHRNYVDLLERGAGDAQLSTGESPGDLLVIEKLAAALGISMTEFVAEVEQAPRPG